MKKVALWKLEVGQMGLGCMSMSRVYGKGDEAEGSGYMPSSITNVIGQSVMPTSLDNTIRFGLFVDTEWVLCENEWTQMVDGFGYGGVHMWNETGCLMASAGQSMVVRLRSDAP